MMVMVITITIMTTMIITQRKADKAWSKLGQARTEEEGAKYRGKLMCYGEEVRAL